MHVHGEVCARVRVVWPADATSPAPGGNQDPTLART
jgi:hypothetical protein